MYRRILVAVDETDSAFRAAREATALAREVGAALRFVHVGDEPSHAERVLKPVTGIAERAGVPSECGLLSAGPADVAGVVRREAARWRADLIVVGSHGRHGLERLLFGSVSESIAGQADISVLVVHQTTPGMTMITG